MGDDGGRAAEARERGARAVADLESARGFAVELQSQAVAPSGAPLKARLPRLVFHPPCSLQHGQKLKGVVEQQLGSLGFDIRIADNEPHLCCGSAGTYSVLQPELATQLRDRKLGHLQHMAPETIVSANIGCITHLQGGTSTPVRHWVEVLDDALRD